MKKIIHKNQVVITTLAVLIAIAGYVSYDRKNEEPGETKTVVNTDADTILDGTNDSYDDIVSDISDGESVALASTEDAGPTENPGEAVLTSTGVSSADYAAQVKLNREQMRSRNKETLQSVIDSTTIEEAQKQAAIDEMVAMTELAEKESGAEMMLEAKGFSNVVVSISDDQCDVVLDMGDVTDAKRAQVEDIVKRKTGVAAENIVITPIQ